MTRGNRSAWRSPPDRSYPLGIHPFDPTADGGGRPFASSSRSRRRRRACNSWPRSPRGTARTTWHCRCSRRPRASARPTRYRRPAQWLNYRGHLERISGNLFLGVVNAFTGVTGEGKDPLDGTTRPFPDIAKHLGDEGVGWCVIGDANYGEGSSREHAAMEPRYRGGLVVIARSFARIHETNLKKQGMLPLTFVDPSTYDDDRRGRPDQRARTRVTRHPARTVAASSRSPTDVASTSSVATRSATTS